MSYPHDQLASYVDGQLDAAESDAFALHLAVCAACRDALHDTLQLVALEATVRGSAMPVHNVPAAVAENMGHNSVRNEPVITAMPGVASMPALLQRSRGWWHRGRVPIIAAAAMFIGVWWIRHHMPDESALPQLALATAQTRGIEGRISYAAADQHRAYGVSRAGSAVPPSDTIPFDTFAQLERREDFHGVAAAFMLLGDRTRVATYLDRASPSPDVATDRALLQLLTGHPAEALITLDGVLTISPQHPQALWNRALALRDLGLTLSAAEAFEVVAALDEPGWAAEARTRAQALSNQILERKTAFEQLALTDGPRLATTPNAVTPEIARRFPGMARLLFYDGVRGATSADAVRALAPLAHAIDIVYGGNILATYIERIAHADFAVRAPLAKRYAAIVAGEQLNAAAMRDFLFTLRVAKADDILIGALIRAIRYDQVTVSVIPELRNLAEATGDPWFHLLAVERAVGALIAQGDHVAAEALALPALTACETSRFDYRCVSLALALSDSYLRMVRLSDAQRLLAANIDRAHRGGEWYLEEGFLARFAQFAVVSDDIVGSTLPIARAYTHEMILREPNDCDYKVFGSEQIAMLLVNRLDLAGARTELAQADAARAQCPSSGPTVQSMFVAAHVLRDPTLGTLVDVERLRVQIGHAREKAKPTDRVMLDQIEGRLMIDRDHAAGTVLLERAIAGASTLFSGDIEGRKARSYAYSVLTLDAGRAGNWERVWALLERATRGTAVSRCALGVAAEDGSSVVVARDPSGTSLGLFDASHSGPATDVPRLVPAQLRDALRACSEVEVLARPPVQGLPELLPAEFAWSYRIDGGDGGRSEPRLMPRHAKRVVIADTEPPASLSVARLSPWRSAEMPDVQLDGPAATPSRALAEFTDATFIEIHSHGMVDAGGVDASFLMLSPESDGHYALTATAIRQQHLRGRPIVILAACHAAKTATYRHEAWSLPAAFVTAGARAVIASTDVIDDDAAGAFFDDVHSRIERGASLPIALRDARLTWLVAHPAATWVRSLMVFQ